MRLAVMVLLFAPLASAGYAPGLYFLAPSDNPLEPRLAELLPEGNTSRQQPILALGESPGVVFLSPNAANGTQVLGRVLAGVWLDSDATQGAMEARVVLHLENGSLMEVSRAEVPLSLDPAAAPDPAALLPSDPTDPEAAVYYAAANVLPLIQSPPFLLDMGFLAMDVPEGAKVAIEFRLVEDESTGLPAIGIAQIAYDSALAPSFLYVPWWSPDAASPGSSPGAPPGSPPASPPQASPSAPPSPSPSPSESDNESPSIGVVVLLVGALLMAQLHRQRR